MLVFGWYFVGQFAEFLDKLIVFRMFCVTVYVFYFRQT